ncbi:TraI domain-containing protein [Aquisalimonas sp. APHAB1-3]|uniref:TraI domain-containing protein n=1 Tax=Aquisalimonas sp. APHAB1-3 TaxID=3402080 RepID=UPI003AAB432A
MGMTIERLLPLLEHPELHPDEPIAGTYGLEPINTGRGSDGQHYARVRVFDYTGATSVFLRHAEWQPQTTGLTPQHECNMAFTFQRGRHGNMVPLAVPAHGLAVPQRSPLELLPGHVTPDLNDLAHLLDLAKSLQTPGLRWFLESVFSNRDFAKAFVTMPAAKKCHHAVPGGLLSHSLEVATGVKVVVNAMPSNRIMDDAAIVVALLHDVGKVTLAQDNENRVPCLARDHGSLIQYALQDSLAYISRVDRDAHDALWRIIQAYQTGQHYDVPLATLIKAADSVSAQADALSRGPQEKDRYWQTACGGKPIWRPPQY